MSAFVSSDASLAALSAAVAGGMRLFEPPAPLTLSEWADEYAYLPRETSALPGKFQTSTAEYQRGIQDAITDPAIETVVMMMASQTGKTQMQLNTIGYYSHHEPAPMLMVQPTIDEAEKFSKNRIAKMIRDTPALSAIFPEPRSRDSGNTLLNKEFTGGVLTMAGANAPAGLASKPVRILLPDEVDRFPASAGTEGDPVDLAVKRTTTFWNRKIAMASTPGIKGVSRIEQAYEASDQRRYFVPCPHCGEYQVLEWKRLTYTTAGDGDKERPISWTYACVSGCAIEERSKHDMIRRGQWRATAESTDGKTAGFHLNALYSPMVEWRDLIVERLAGKFSVERLKTFVNTRLAETWEIRGEGAERSELEKRPTVYASKLPEGVLMVTAGVDVQKRRLESTKYGWGLDGEVWAVEHRVFEGDPSLPEEHPDSLWPLLDSWLQEDMPHELSVTMRVSCALIDSGGHHTKQVYAFTGKRETRRIYACKGMGGIGKPLVSSGNRVGPKKTLLYGIGVDTAKERIYTTLRVNQPGPGYVHFPEDEGFNAEFFRQLTAEQLVESRKSNVTRLYWVKKYERNEALDCCVYALAAVDVLRPNLAKIAAGLAERVQEIKEATAQRPLIQPRQQKSTATTGDVFRNRWGSAWKR